MIDRSIAVFSGVHPKVVEHIAPTLRSTGIESVTVNIGSNINWEYFERLAKQTLYIAQKEAGRANVRITSALISGLSETEIENEANAFFPALRRVPIRPEWRNNPSASGKIIQLVQEHFRNNKSKHFTRQVAASQETRFLLPPKNTPSKSLLSQFKEIYNGNSYELSRKIEKDIVSQRGGKGLKVLNLSFLPTLNNEQHPVRRCTDTFLCDLRANFRFGASIPARFEFDVTADNGLKNKSFCQCDGSVHRISTNVTHLNMRINDDFKEG